MGKTLFVLIVCIGGWFGYKHFFPDKPVHIQEASVQVEAPNNASDGLTTKEAAVIGFVAGTVAAPGFWATLIGGGWFLGEMTLFLWALLGLFVLVPVIFIASLTELPDDSKSGWNIGRSLFSFAIMVAILSWGGIPIWQTIKAHPFTIVLYFLVYLGVGILWSAFKYNIFAKACKEEIYELAKVFCKKTHLDVSDVLVEKDGKYTLAIPRNHQAEWIECIENASTRLRASGVSANRPAISFMENKERILLWVLFWPASALRSLCRDFIVRIADEVVDALRGMYEKIAMRHAVEVTYVDPKLAEGKTKAI